MTRTGSALDATADPFSVLVRKQLGAPSEVSPRCAYVAGAGPGRSAFLALAAASDSFPGWESSTREAFMHASASLVHRPAGVPASSEFLRKEVK